jgi:large subunit ribosomal protein L29
MTNLALLRDMTRGELDQKLNELIDEQFNLRMRRSLKPLDNPLRLREIGREVAQIKTILHEDDLGIRKLAEQRTSILADTKSKKDVDKTDKADKADK